MVQTLILGGYGGVGRRTARRVLSETDCSVVLAGRHEDQAEALAGLLNKEFTGGRVTAVAADAASPASLEAAFQGVDLVIRGEDLLGSTGRQLRLARMLGREAPPRFLHHPLIHRPDGSKLSKANRDTGLRDLRAAAHSPESLLGEAAARSGLLRHPRPLRAADLPGLFAG